MKYEHEDIGPVLADYLAGRLVDAKALLHIQQCAECREELGLLRELRELEEFQEEPGLREFFDTLPGAVLSKSAGSLRKGTFPFRWYGLAASVMLAFILLFAVSGNYTGRGDNASDKDRVQAGGLKVFEADPVEIEKSLIADLRESGESEAAAYVYASVEPTWYYADLLSMGPEELEAMYDSLVALENENGGVL